VTSRAPDDPTELILARTVVARPALCPELRMHIVTEDCSLWRAREEDLETLGIPSPFWAFVWAGGEALARYLLDHPERVAGRRVLDFGAGSGVQSLAAARAGAHVVATDLDPVARRCLELNAALNGLALETSGRDVLGRADVDADVVLVGDVTYDPDLGRRVADWAESLAGSGREVLLADPGRGCLPDGAATRWEELAVYRAPADNDRGQRSLVRVPVYRVTPKGDQAPPAEGR